MFDITMAGEELTVTFPEKMDTVTCQKHEHEIGQKLAQGCKSVTFDLAGVDYVCSYFLRICMRAAQAVGKDHFAVANVTPEVKRVLKISGLDGQITIR